MAVTNVCTLRSASLGALVVAAAAQGEYAAIARLVESGLWMPSADVDTAVYALLDKSSLHDVYCRRGIEAVLSGRHSTRARAVFRSRAFVAAFGRLFDDGRIGMDVATRLVRMGASTKLLSTAVLRHLPTWGGLFLRTVPKLPGTELVELVIGSARPGALMLLISDDFDAHPDRVFFYRPDAADDAALLGRLADDAEFMTSRHAGPFVRRILYLACRTGSERLIEAIEAADDDDAVIDMSLVDALCRELSPNLTARVNALPIVRTARAARAARYAMNYNVLRIMGGLGGLTYTS